MSVRPSVTLKLATSLDGRIATASGESKWITGGEARAEVHKLRAAHDAIIVGSETVIADDPELTARGVEIDHQPLRIVADSRGRTPATAKLFATLEKARVAIATLETTDVDAHNWPTHKALQFWMLPKGDDGRIDLRELMEMGAGAGVASMLIEGGGTLAASFVKAGLVDRIEWFRAPILLGSDSRAALGELHLESLSAAPRYERVGVREVGVDLWESYVRKA
jgi:diaminohydroxyphosphoribosylaminopyrimidine deaminase/5-amino-6-(5-phosphoribosylamino)uracil reductase